MFFLIIENQKPENCIDVLNLSSRIAFGLMNHPDVDVVPIFIEPTRDGSELSILVRLQTILFIPILN